jgi:hypothetical protein
VPIHCGGILLLVRSSRPGWRTGSLGRRAGVAVIDWKTSDFDLLPQAVLMIDHPNRKSKVRFRQFASLKRDEIKLNRHRALASCLSMIFSENRFTLFRIML